MTPDQLEALLTRRELRNFDFKGPVSFEGDFRIELAVAIAAMANTPGGGTILVGVSEEGADRRIRGVTAEQRKTFDPTLVGQYLRERLDPVPDFEVVDILDTAGGDVVEIRVSEFRDVPIVVKRTLQKREEKNATGREGDILIRSREAQSRRVMNAEETREILGRAISRTSERLLEQIRAVVTGARMPEPLPSYEERHRSELPRWPEQLEELRSSWPDLARWEFRFLPQPPHARLDPGRAAQLLRDSVVSLRGWDFPAMPPGGPTFFQDQLTVAVDWDRFHERTSLGYDGAFGFARILWTEVGAAGPLKSPPPPERPIDFVGVLLDVTEFLRFAVTLGEKLGAESLWLDLRLEGIRGRRLGSLDPRRFLHREFVAAGSEVHLSETQALGLLQAGWKDLAVEWTRRIFTVFQWPDAKVEMLQADQESLLRRRE